LKKADEQAEKAARERETNELINATQTNFIKLEVTVTEASLFAEDSTCNQLVMDMLKDRVKE